MVVQAVASCVVGMQTHAGMAASVSVKQVRATRRNMGWSVLLEEEPGTGRAERSTEHR